MSPGGWGAGETGGFFHTLEVCEGVWSLGAVCVFVLQAVGCLCSNTGRFPSTPLCSRAASVGWGGCGGVPSQAARLVTQACSPACPLWWGAGTRTWHQEAGGGRRPLKAGDRVKGGQLWAGPAASSRVWGSERQPEGPAGSGNVSSAPRALATCCWPYWHRQPSGWLQLAG